ncbi:MAG: hypothetical protein GF347_01755 [Candidatus Moranbacteria bacterium]|nr:hypothetical protein [Candidatus Moranbacteria bacterium]
MSQETKIKYFVYIRKSSDREDAQMLSLQAQKRELKKSIKRTGLKVVGWFEESASAYKKGRKEFNRMLGEIEKGKANGILVYHLTRIARNSFDGGNVIYMMDDGLIKEIRTPEKAYYSHISDDKFIMQIHFAIAKKSSDDTSQFVRRDIQSKLLKGEYPIGAPVGYLNLNKDGIITGKRHESKKQFMLENMADKEGRELKRVEPDPLLAPAIKKLYEYNIKGIYSINDLREISYDLGIKGQRSQKMLTKSTLKVVLSNPFYYGAIPWKGDIHEPDDLPRETAHDPIISKKMFNKSLEVLGLRSKPRSQTHNHRYTGMVRCGECDSMITAEIQKGITYYRCSKKKGKCSQGYLREDKFEDQVLETIREYVFPSEFVEWALDVLRSTNKEETKRIKNLLAIQRKRLTETEDELRGLLKMKLSKKNLNNDYLDDEEYLSQKKELKKEKKQIREKIEELENRNDNWLEQCEKFFNFTMNVEKRWDEDDPEDKRLIFKVMFGSNAILKDKKLLIKANNPFIKREKLSDKSKWRALRDGFRTLDWAEVYEDLAFVGGRFGDFRKIKA